MTDRTVPAMRSPEDKQLAEELVERAKNEGVELVGPEGLLAGLTKNVLEAGLEAEMSEHLGYDKHDPAGRNKANSRNGTRAKRLVTDVGPVDIEVPRDRDGSFEPQLVKKHQRRLTGVDEMVISLTAKGLTTGEVAAHLAEVYGTEVSRDTISRITDRVLGEMSEWQNRPLDRVNDEMSSWRNRRTADSKWAWHINGGGTIRCMDSLSATSYVGSGDNDEASSIVNYTLDTHC